MEKGDRKGGVREKPQLMAILYFKERGKRTEQKKKKLWGGWRTGLL